MRVIAGSAGSLILRYPKGVHIRPTTDAMRESLFASLGERVEGARFADLYAGCGSVGIEALSRGAELCVFVEKAPRCAQALRANLESTGLAESAIVECAAVERVWSRVCQSHGPFDIVFADPPYELESFPEVANRLIMAAEGVAQGGLVVLQYRVGSRPPGLPSSARTKRFGETMFEFFERD